MLKIHAWIRLWRAQGFIALKEKYPFISNINDYDSSERIPMSATTKSQVNKNTEVTFLAEPRQDNIQFMRNCENVLKFDETIKNIIL